MALCAWEGWSVFICVPRSVSLAGKGFEIPQNHAHPDPGTWRRQNSTRACHGRARQPVLPFEKSMFARTFRKSFLILIVSAVLHGENPGMVTIFIIENML
jgi:hypothetical protein